MNRTHFYFTIIVASIFVIIVSPTLFRDGMFIDGLVYADVARNLAKGLGGFWSLHYTNTLLPEFHEHPPLAFGLQALLFKVFGDSIYVERYYSIVTFFISGGIIVLIWRKIVVPSYKHLYWLPLMLWIAVPLVTWGASNNMLENTMTIFDLLALYFIICYIYSKKSFDYIAIAGLMVFLSFLSKGFVGLYMWSAFFMIWIVRRDAKFYTWAVNTLLIIIFSLVSFWIISLIWPESIACLKAYFDTQVVKSIQTVTTVDSRFFIIKKVFSEFIPALALTLIVLGIKKYKFIQLETIEAHKKWAITLVLIAFSGIIPIMISMKQSGYYALTTFPLLAIALALVISVVVKFWVDKIATQSKYMYLAKYVMCFFIVFAISFAVFQHGKVGRDEKEISDIKTFIKFIPSNSTIGIPKSIYTEWSYHGYFSRYANISLDPDRPFVHDFFIKELVSNDTVSSNFEKVEIPTLKFLLYRKRIK